MYAPACEAAISVLGLVAVVGGLLGVGYIMGRTDFLKNKQK